MEPIYYLIAIFGGLIAGIINTLAGNGSVITLTILTEIMGLPPNVANGTNRIGIWTQCVSGSYSFYKNGKLDFKRAKIFIIPAVLGAILGVSLAVNISNDQFKDVFRYLMLLLLILVILNPKKWMQESQSDQPLNIWIIAPLFFALGFYGGFIQMGMGIFFLFVMLAVAKYDIIESNAIKVFVIAIYMIVVIAIFQWKGLIDWKIGGIMAIGQTIGGYYTANYASNFPNAKIWAYRFLLVAMAMAIVKMFY